MKIGLHDAEKEHFRKTKTFPNFALMKISSWHKHRGDAVEWWNPLFRYDRVYSSKIFDFTTFYRTRDGISVRCGCFCGTLEAFNVAVKEIHGDSRFGKEYFAAVKFAKGILLGKIHPSENH